MNSDTKTPLEGFKLPVAAFLLFLSVAYRAITKTRKKGF